VTSTTDDDGFADVDLRRVTDRTTVVTIVDAVLGTAEHEVCVDGPFEHVGVVVGLGSHRDGIHVVIRSDAGSISAVVGEGAPTGSVELLAEAFRSGLPVEVSLVHGSAGQTVERVALRRPETETSDPCHR
jgi:hypothetical protein